MSRLVVGMHSLLCRHHQSVIPHAWQMKESERMQPVRFWRFHTGNTADPRPGVAGSYQECVFMTRLLTMSTRWGHRAFSHWEQYCSGNCIATGWRGLARQ
eukprot:4892315-Prymnesium_polylepis.2